MKLLKLEISSYKVLSGIEIDFDLDDSLSVIIGKNGSGKTTLIEAITLIFSRLLSINSLSELKKVNFPFHFSISYLLRHQKEIEEVSVSTSYVDYIQIDINYFNELSFKLTKGSEVFESLDLIENHLRQIGESKNYILPRNLVVYYSGISDIILKLFRKYQDENILGSLDGDVTINQPFYFFNPEDLPIILIALLSFQFGDIPEKLQNKFGINGFKSININFKRPRWAKGIANNFWGARGDLKNFLILLYESSDESEFEENYITFVFKSIEKLENVWSNLGTEKRLFEYLVALQANDLIGSISIILFKNGNEIDYQRLSEGEKQSLIIIGLVELLATENSLFLLDEPDTYLHPKWKREFIFDYLNLVKVYNNFTIITSHSPNIVSGLKKSQLKILNNKDGTSKLKHFEFNPYGKTVDNILIDFFGVEGLRFKEVEDNINLLWDMINKNEYKSTEFLKIFDTLNKEIGKDDEDLVAMKIEIAKKENAKNK